MDPRQFNNYYFKDKSNNQNLKYNLNINKSKDLNKVMGHPKLKRREQT